MVTFFDITIIIILTIFSFFGLYQGIIGFVSRICGFFASLLLTYFLYPHLLELIEKYIYGNEIIQIIFAAVISYVVSLILCIFVVYKFLVLTSFIRGGFIDKILGLFAGLIVGVIVSVILFLTVAIFTSEDYFENSSFKKFVLNTNKDKYSGILKNSVTTNYLDQISRNIITVMPINMLQSIKILDKKKATSRTRYEANHKANSEELEEELDTIDDVFSLTKGAKPD